MFKYTWVLQNGADVVRTQRWSAEGGRELKHRPHPVCSASERGSREAMHKERTCRIGVTRGLFRENQLISYVDACGPSKIYLHSQVHQYFCLLFSRVLARLCIYFTPLKRPTPLVWHGLQLPLLPNYSSVYFSDDDRVYLKTCELPLPRTLLCTIHLLLSAFNYCFSI